MKKILFAFAMLCIFATAASADDKFGQMDTNSDDTVTWEEFAATYPSMKKFAFESIDTDKSDGISHDEWHGFMSGHNKAGQKGGGMMGGMMGGKKGANMMGTDASDEAPQLIAPPSN
ncbi:MAG: calcium-binding protein [Desulfovibrionales bacterium]|nr:calcium-binding protein [Desulfovibrionales bacterium]